MVSLRISNSQPDNYTKTPTVAHSTPQSISLDETIVLRYLRLRSNFKALRYFVDLTIIIVLNII